MSPGNQVMYYLVDGPEKAFIKVELMLIPEDTELPPDYIQNGDTSKMNFPTPEEFEQNKVLHDKILKWQEVPTEVIYHIETVEQITTKSRVKMVASLVDEDGTSFKAFTTSCLEKDLKDFGWGEEWFIKSLGKRLSSKNPIQRYYH